MPFNTSAAEEYGQIRFELQKSGHLIGPLDMLIAASARAEGLILVSNNTKEFERVSDLQLENWIEL